MNANDVFIGDAHDIYPLIQLRLAEPANATLITGVKRDIALVRQLPASEPVNAQVLTQNDSSLVIKLIDEPWARRVNGVLGNQNLDKACAIVTEQAGDSYLVSIHSPLSNRTGADELARQFSTGGGRKAAAGIDALPGNQLDEFLNTIATFWS